MTNDQLKDIFGRFHNLNLLTLIYNLEIEKVLTGNWLGKMNRCTDMGAMCPLWHGTAKGGYGRSSSPTCKKEPARSIGISESTVDQFTRWWDSSYNFPRLTRALKEILAERIQDADAVQVVIQQARRLRNRNGRRCYPHHGPVRVFQDRPGPMHLGQDEFQRDQAIQTREGLLSKEV